MNEEWEYIDIFEGLMNLFALPFYIIGLVFTLLIFKNKKTASRAILTLLMFGGCLFSVGEVIEIFISFEYYPELDEIGDSYNIFLASVLLILGFIVVLEQKVKISEQKFKHLFENSPYSVVLLELNGTIIDLNIATKRLFGLKKGYLIGRNFSEFFQDSSKLSIILKERIEVMKQGKVLELLELQLIKKKNLLIWVELQSSLFKLENEIFLQVILQDISERKQAEKIIKEELKRLKEIDKIRSDFVRRTSHELKTPLISIYSSSQYLLDNFKKNLSEDMVKLLETINRGGKRLKRLTENLLDIFDLETKSLRLKKQKIDLVEIIKENVKDFSLTLKERDLFLKLDLIDSCFIYADKIRIEQVISNLLSNAIKNTPPKGIIYVGLKKIDDYVEIIIKDTGIGFTEAEKEIAFKKFGKIERVDVEKDIITEGSGLGLYISKQMVNLQDGKIWLESEGRDKGSTFIIHLPIK
ncbi:MAG: ATP-binding protein [Promethearchaeota archaeon]